MHQRDRPKPFMHSMLLPNHLYVQLSSIRLITWTLSSDADIRERDGNAVNLLCTAQLFSSQFPKKGFEGGRLAMVTAVKGEYPHTVHCSGLPCMHQ